MAAVAPVALHVIAGKLQSAGQHLVALVPVAEQRVPHVVAAVLDEHPQGQWLGLPDQGLQVVAAAHGHKRAHTGEDLAEQVGPVPCGIEGRDAATAQAEDHSVPWASRQADGLAARGLHLLYGGQHLFLEKPCKKVGRRVKLIAAVIAQHGTVGGLDKARLQEHADGHGHLARGNERVHDLGRIAQHAVQPHIQGRGALAVVLVGHIDLEGMGRTLIVLRLVECAVEQGVACHRM